MDRHQSNVENTKFIVGGADDFEFHGEKRTNKVENEELEHNDDGQISSLDQHIVTFDQTSNYSMEEIEEVYGMIEEERRNINHILEIKELLVNSENETEKEITVSLQMLTLIVVSLEDLMVTNIGTTVSGLQLHWSKKVIREAKRVVEKFKTIIEERIDENADLSARTKGQDPPTTLDEHLLFNPPMDEGVHIDYIPKLDFTTFFEDIDDDGNLITHNYGSKEFHESQINPSTENNTDVSGSASISNTIQKEKQEFIDKLISPKNHTAPHKNRGIEMINEGQIYPPITKRKLELLLKQDSKPTPTKKRQKPERRESSEKWNNKMSYRPSDTALSLQRFANHMQQKDSNNDRKTVKKDEHKVHQRSNVGLRHSRGTSDDVAKMEEKLETSKRKLQQGYQTHERERRGTRYFEGYEYETPKDEYTRRSSRPRCSNRSWRYS